MSEELFKILKEGISHRIACIERPYINGFAGTGRSRRRTTADIHTLAQKIMDRTFDPYRFHWNFGNKEEARHTDVYLVVLTCLFDIDDEDAKRWSSKTEWDIAKHEAARDIAHALMRKFDVERRHLIMPKCDNQGGLPGSPGGAHGLSNSRYDDERDW